MVKNETNSLLNRLSETFVNFFTTNNNDEIIELEKNDENLNTFIRITFNDEIVNKHIYILFVVFITNIFFQKL